MYNLEFIFKKISNKFALWYMQKFECKAFDLFWIVCGIVEVKILIVCSMAKEHTLMLFIFVFVLFSDRCKNFECICWFIFRVVSFMAKVETCM